MSRKGKTAIISILCFLLIVAVGFMITSLSMASAHGQTLIEEWQSWFNVVKDTIETLPTEDTSAVIKMPLRLIKVA